MASIVPGYKYDIFISYRQKDNKGEHWVTEFVSALKIELEATFKEDISIYFDENPHDGLLETNDVSESLREKLKCPIFIPVISQTYCDPRSFAWNDEFIAYKKLASEDQFGLKVKLSNGNVSSRILPIRIHELDAHDKAILENEFGPLRAIDFIFKSTGVNRPLQVHEDHPNDNLNKTYYRDQVNKVANAIKEILSALINPVQSGVSEVKQEPNLNLNEQYSVAVLPFANMSSDPEQEFFSDGISEEIINLLAHVPHLKVAGRTSCFNFKGKNLDLRAIGDVLNVNYILEGSVRKSLNKLRITAQFISVNDGYHLWSEKFDRELKDIFDIQDEIALAVAKKLELTLPDREHEMKRRNYTPDQFAYDFYLKGRYCWNKRNEKFLTMGVKYFEEAIEKDPLYASAYAGLADCYNILGFYSILPSNKSFPKAQEYALKALTIDASHAEAYSALGFSRMYYDWNWIEADKAFRKALEFNPAYGTAHHWYAECLALTGRMDEAVLEARKALDSDPLSLIINTLMGWVYYYSRNYNQAIEHLEKTLDLDPSFEPAYLWLVLSYGKAGIYDQGLAVFENGIKYSEKNILLKAAFCLALIQSGENSKSKQMLNELMMDDALSRVSPYYAGAIHCANKNLDSTFEWLNKAVREHDIWISYLKVDPIWDDIRTDKRFTQILRAVNLE